MSNIVSEHSLYFLLWAIRGLSSSGQHSYLVFFNCCDVVGVGVRKTCNHSNSITNTVVHNFLLRENKLWKFKSVQFLHFCLKCVKQDTLKPNWENFQIEKEKKHPINTLRRKIHFQDLIMTASHQTDHAREPLKKYSNL